MKVDSNLSGHESLIPKKGTPRMIFSKARRLNERGRKLADKGWFAEAEEAYREAADAAPEWSVPWYNLGHLHKYRGNWDASLESNQRAVELSPSDGDSWWNLGIAATALGGGTWPVLPGRTATFPSQRATAL